MPKVEGPISCNALSARYWYDHNTRQCGAFWWRGCRGNANNFESWEKCQEFCAGIGPISAEVLPVPYSEISGKRVPDGRVEVPPSLTYRPGDSVHGVTEPPHLYSKFLLLNSIERITTSTYVANLQKTQKIFVV